MQDHVDKGQAFSTIKGYLAAISACPVGFGGDTVGLHPLVRQFMKGVKREGSREVKDPFVGLDGGIRGLISGPFRATGVSGLEIFITKNGHTVGSDHCKKGWCRCRHQCLCFAVGDTRVTFKPNPAFVPKNFLAGCNPVEWWLSPTSFYLTRG